MTIVGHDTPNSRSKLEKCPTGIRGLDAITGGGLPQGRSTLVCGSAGSGKTLMAMEFLVRGIETYDEPGVFMCFEEVIDDLAVNVESLGFDVRGLIAHDRLAIDRVQIDASEITETGEYNLDGIFIRLGAAIDAVGAKRVVLDTIEALFSALSDRSVVRSELARLFTWLKMRGVTSIVTAERGDGVFTRDGLEEYVSDCVILLDQRVIDQIATRRLRIVKYRGSAHGSNEYPFLIDEHGFTVLPITDIDLDYVASREFVSTGVEKLDTMLAAKGYYRGGSMLLSGSAGTGKSSIAASFIDGSCRREERCIYFAFEESADQIVRNMLSIGIDLAPAVARGVLQFSAARPASFGLEVHLSKMWNLIERFDPKNVVVDPMSSFIAAGTPRDARAMLMRLFDFLKMRNVTVLVTSLTNESASSQSELVDISSLLDTWIVLRNLEHAGERTRTLSIMKSRGMKHSNQSRELLLTDRGVDLADVFVGPGGAILTGSARATQESADRATAVALDNDNVRKVAALERKREIVRTRIAEMQAELEAEISEVDAGIAAQASTAASLLRHRDVLARERGGASTLDVTHNGAAR